MTFNDFLHQIEDTRSLTIVMPILGENLQINSQDYTSSIKRTASWLQKELGYSGGKKVLSVIENGIDWNVLDAAVLVTGNKHIALSPSTPEKEISDLLERLDVDLAVISSLTFQILGKSSLGRFNLLRFESIPSLDDEFQKNALKEDVSVGVFLTSGTSSQKKAVVHSHEFILNNVQRTASFYNFGNHDIALSFLPIHYAFERMYNYIYQWSGMKIVYADRAKSLLENIIQIKPTVFCIVPALLDELLRKESNVSLFLDYYRTVQPRIICSGAKIPQSTFKLLEAHKVEIYEMYGSTETLIVSCSKPGQTKSGTSGKILDLDKIKLNDSNELLVEVKKSAYLDGFGDKERFDKGYYNTGDSVKIDNGFLTIQGRTSSIVKNRFGVFIDLLKLEEALKQYLDGLNVIIFFHEDVLACIIENANSLKISDIESCLKQYNLERIDGEKVHYFALTDLWYLDSKLYTLSNKLKKNELIEKYIEQMIKLD